MARLSILCSGTHGSAVVVPREREWSLECPGLAEEEGAVLARAGVPRRVPGGAGATASPLACAKGSPTGAADRIFDAFHGPARSVDEPTGKAARELAGWESAAALRTSLKNWQNQSKAAETWLTRIAESLRASSRTYASTEKGVEQQFSVLRTYG